MTEKATNPKDVVSIRKMMFSVVPWGVMAELGLAFLEGARKYGRHNYRIAGVRASVYYDAMWRHMGAWWEGQDIDPDSRLNHVIKAIATLVVLRDSMMSGNWVDDRPPVVLAPDFAERMNTLAGEIIDRCPEGKPAFTQVEHGLKRVPLTWESAPPPELAPGAIYKRR